jgi:hypothetical protein
MAILEFIFEIIVRFVFYIIFEVICVFFRSIAGWLFGLSKGEDTKTQERRKRKKLEREKRKHKLTLKNGKIQKP